jgi:alpha-ketoglutarate-dependent 2,4-dichlorophenoxyacetate dioxygenase
MGLAVRSLKTGFAAQVSGLDLRKPLEDSVCEALRATFDEYPVTVFAGQNISDAEQIAFSKRFGVLEQPGAASNITKPQDRRLGQSEMADISNLDKNGAVLEGDARQRMFNLGNRLWHSDSSFRVVPAQYSMLSAREVPGQGGQTQFADMRAAYAALDAETQTQLAELICEHSLLNSRGVLGFDDDLSAQEKANFKPVRQRLVRTHPSTGRRSLYLSAHLGSIVGWPTPEARILIRELSEDATREEFVYTHEWRQYDLVVWDNQCTMHRARPFKDRQHVRDMRRTTVAGVAPTVVGQAS